MMHKILESASFSVNSEKCTSLISLLQGKHLGRKGQDTKEIKRALKLFAEREKNGLSVNDISKQTGVPRSTIYAKAKVFD